MNNAPPLPEYTSNDDLISELIRRLTKAEADLRAALPAEVDAFIDPVTASPILLREAQRALQESETRYRQQADKLEAIFLTMTDAVIVYHAAGVAVQANPAIVAILGFNPLGMNVAEIYGRTLAAHPDGTAMTLEEFPAIQAMHGTFVVDKPFIITNVTDQHKISVLASASPLFEQGKPSGVVAIWHDFTERDKAEQVLRQHDALLEKVAVVAQRRADELTAIFAAMTNAVTIFNADAMLIEANPAAKVIFGLNGVNTPLVPIIQIASENQFSYPDGRLAVQDDFPVLRALRNEVVISERFDLTNPEGRKFAVLVSASPLHEKGNISGAVVVLNDITQREQATQALQEAAQFNRVVLDSLLSHLAVLDKSGTIVAVNEAWEQFARDNGDPLLARTGVGMSYLAVCQRSARSGNEDAEKVLAGLQAVLKGSQSMFEFEYACHSPSQQRWFVMRVTPLISAAGGVVISHRDTTERILAERSRRFLSEASTTLSSSLDYRVKFTQLAQLAVPTIADWCIVHIIDKNGTIQEVAITHRDPSKAAWAAEAGRNYPPEPNTKSLVWRVLETGKAELYPEITDAMLVDRARDAQHLAFLRKIGFASLMVVPLVSHGRTLGAVQFVLSETGRHFNDSDLALAEELAYRAAIAIDNARLYQEASEQRERLQITLSSMSDGMISTDTEGHVAFMNPAAEALTGWTQAEAEGAELQQVFTIADETSRERTENPVIKIMREGVVVGVANHTILVARDGREHYIDHNAAPIRDDAGAIVGVILVFRDVSSQRQAQIALRDSEQRFKAIFDQAAVGMIQSALDGRALMVNQHFCEMLGYRQEELLNHPFSEFTHPDELPVQLEGTRQLLAGEFQSYSIEKRYIRKGGSHLWANVTTSLVQSREDTPAYFVSIVENITERKRADEQVRFQAHLLDTVGQSVIATDLQGKVIYWNRFAEVLYGWSAAEAMGHQVAELIVSATTQEQAAEIMAHLKNGESWSGEFVVQRRDGTPFPAQVSDSPIYDVNGALVGIIGVSTDVTERKRADEQVRFQAHVLDTVGQSVITTDLQGKVIYWNRFAEVLYGWSAAEAVGKYVAELVVSYRTPEQAIEMMDRLRNGENWTGDFMIQRRDGTVFPALVTNSPIYDVSGTLSGIIRLSSDITERKQAEQAIYIAQVAEHEQRVFAEALRDITLTHINTTDRNVVLRRILDNVGRVVAHDFANIMLIEDGMVSIVASSGQMPAQSVFDRRPVPLKEVPGLSRLLKTGEALVVSDTQLYPDWVDLRGDNFVRSYVSSPIRVHEQIFGFLNLDSATPGFFTPAHAERLQAFANEAAIAIENAQLYDQLQAHAVELETRVAQRTQELRVAKERVESILDNTSDAILLLNSDGSIEQSNPAFNTLFGYRVDEVFKQPLTLLVESDKAQTIQATLEYVIQSHEPMRIELVVCRKDNSTFSADIAMTAIREQPITNFTVICSVRDNTPQKRLEQELRGALEQAQELSELKSRFVSMASHEFRTPLATILASTDFLSAYRHRITDDQIEQRFDKIRDQIEHLKEIMDDVLQLAQLQARQVEFKPEMLDLDALCQTIVNEYQSHPDIHQQLDYTCNNAVRELNLDKRLMRQIISNLVSNAIKYSPAEKPITIHLDFITSMVVLSVSDQGIGIPESDQKHLFEPFHRGANVGAISGTGLGLVILKESVDMYGGTITVNSQANIGTTFTVRIPFTSEGVSKIDKDSGN